MADLAPEEEATHHAIRIVMTTVTKNAVDPSLGADLLDQAQAKARVALVKYLTTEMLIRRPLRKSTLPP